MSAIRFRLTMFAVIAAVAVGYTGARYAQVTDWITNATYSVNVELAKSGGIFPGAEVTYRGVPIGRVSSVVLTPTGVDATLAIRRSWKVPADVTANVHDRSVVGEQYVDLVPDRDAGPYLGNGSTIAEARTSTPLPVDQLIQTLDEFVQSVGVSNLHTVVTELGTAFGGRGGELATILDSSSHLVAAASANLPATLDLVNHADTVLTTQLAGASDLQAFSRGLAQVTGTIRDDDPALRALLASGPVLAQQLTSLVNALSAPLPTLLSTLIGVDQVTLPNLDNLGNTFAIAPWDVAAVQAVVRNGRSYLGLAANQTPMVCQQGYIPPAQWRSVNDLSTVPAPWDPHCAESGKNWRGTAQTR